MHPQSKFPASDTPPDSNGAALSAEALPTAKNALSALDAFARRGTDLAISASVLLLLFPFLVLLALLVRLDSPGPVLFIQTRVGKHGREFSVFKFRSMFLDAELRLDTMLIANERTGPVFKMRRDPRVTCIGRILRRSSLDELPQLLNVLRGEMSLVGPRPALAREVAQYLPNHQRRLHVTPGLTGLWQVSGRADLSFEDSIQLDLEYVRRQSLWLNLVILARTVPAVLTGQGAY